MKPFSSIIRSRLNKALLILLATGLVISSGFIFYYAIPGLGVPECSDNLTQKQMDAGNCGDGDFGGVIFLLIGLPIVLVSVATLLSSLLLGRFDKSLRPGYSIERLLKLVGLTIIIVVIVNILFVSAVGYYASQPSPPDL